MSIVDTAGGNSSQSCQIISTSGSSYVKPSTTYIQPWPNLTGYTCACGVWVPYGTVHQCSNWWPQIYTWPTTWNWSAMPSITAFKGAVKALKDLPKSGAIGDAYYVTAEDVLVVRQQGGWFHFDKK